MLVLTRKQNESIVFDRHGERFARLTVLRLSGGEVRIGFEADDHVQILREELVGRKDDAA